ncbi:hypothetical protein E2C01_060519 [Portunus trituberculatus]|uniref:Uncharacterized protein n=1 Tax=Portunus trituberculatus TaxID=210409 RepID=A0A5B7H8A9_PORTR|nr:hypothetical protein [Portunus trituberculatus]
MCSTLSQLDEHGLHSKEVEPETYPWNRTVDLLIVNQKRCHSLEGILRAWAVSAVAPLSTHSLTGLPWWTSLTATPATRLDEGRHVLDSSLSVHKYFASGNSLPSISATSTPHVLPLPLKPRHKLSSPGLAKDSNLLQTLHSSHSTHLLFGNKNKDEKKSYSNKENILQNGQMKNETDLSERQKRASVGTYDIPVRVVSYSPTSHFFMHELLHPQPTLGQKSVLESPDDITPNIHVPSSSSSGIVFRGSTKEVITSTAPTPNTIITITPLPSPGPEIIPVVPCRRCYIPVGRDCVPNINCNNRYP